MAKAKPPLLAILLAILHIAVGSLLVIATPLSTLNALSGPPTRMGVSIPQSLNTAAYQAFALCSVAATFYGAVLLVAAGIGLIRLQPWAWTTSIVLSTLALITFVLSRLGFVAIAITGSGGEIYWLALILGTAVLCYPQVVHPLLTFAILLPQSVRSVFVQPPQTLLSSKAADANPVIADADQQDMWYCRTGKQVFGPMSRQQLDETVRQGLVSGSSEVWQTGQPAVWAHDICPQLKTQLPSGWRWLVYGPALPPYRPSDSNGKGGWKWALIIATILYTAILLVIIGLSTKFSVQTMPYLVMGTAAQLAGSFALAATLFEWRWFFENRQARVMRKWAGDQGARGAYMTFSCFVLLVGFGMLGIYAIRNFDRDRLSNVMSAAAPQIDAQATHRFTGERSAQCGGVGGGGFERFDPERRPVIGFRYDLGNWDRQDVIKTIHPLYDRLSSGEGIVMAAPEYQVVGLNVDANEYVNAVQVVFARAHGDVIDLEDTYTSDWLGVTTGRTPQAIGGDGRRVIGIFGRQGLITNALGLMLQPIESVEPPPL